MCARPVCTAQRKTPSLLINDNSTIKRKTLLSTYSRIHNQNNALFAPSLLKIRATRFVLCLYSHNYFEQEIKKLTFLECTCAYLKKWPRYATVCMGLYSKKNPRSVFPCGPHIATDMVFKVRISSKFLFVIWFYISPNELLQKNIDLGEMQSF